MGKMILIKNCINEVLFYLYFFNNVIKQKNGITYTKIKNKKNNKITNQNKVLPHTQMNDDNGI